MANTQAFANPHAVSKDKSGLGIGYDGLSARHSMGALSSPSPGAAYGFLTGVFPGASSGSGPSNDLKGYAAGGMKTGAYAGGYAVDRGSLGLYIGAAYGSNEAVLPTTTTPGHAPSNPSNPRIDIVAIRNRDPAVDSGVTESARLVILQGNPAASPTRPDNLLTNGDVPLYQVLVRADAKSITDDDITNMRRMIVARGGIYPAVPGDTRPGAYEGQYRDNVVFRQLERWSGSTWEAVATPAVWAGFKPRLYAAGSASDVSLGKDGAYIGRCQIVGRTLNFLYYFKWGTKPWNGGFGDISAFLPRHPVLDVQLYGVAYPQWAQAHLVTNTPEYAGDFPGQARVEPNGTRVTPYFAMRHGHFPPNQPVNMNTFPYRVASEQGKANTGIPRIFNPDGYPEGGTLEISGSCEVTW